MQKISKKSKYTASLIQKEAKKYKTRTEFHDNCSTGFKKARELGILDDVCSHMISKRWTKQRLEKEALKYKSRTEFSKHSGGAYSSALKKDLLDEICKHMEVQRTSWTKENILKEAKKYKFRVDFQNGSKNAYHAALRRGLLDEVCAHMKSKVKKWTKKEIHKTAKKFKHRKDFAKNSNGAYDAAKKMNILDEVCSHMEALWEQKWTDESIKKEIKKYKFKSEFINKSRGAYQAALRLGIYKKISKGMPNGRVKWDINTLTKEAKKYKHRSDFASNSGGAYSAALSLGVIDEVCSHMKILYNGYLHCIYSIQNNKDIYIGVTSQRFKERVSQHLKPKNSTNAKEIVKLPNTKFTQLTDYIYTPDEIKKGVEKNYVIKYQKLGFNVLNSSSSLGNIGYSRRKWTDEKLQEEAKKYTGRFDFQKGSPSAYQQARVRGKLEEICQHMPTKHEYWTKGRILYIASLFNSMEEIRRKKSYLHKIIYKNNLQKEVRKNFRNSK